MTDSVVIVQVTTPIVQVTSPNQGVVDVQQNNFGVTLDNICDVAVVSEGSTVVEVGDASDVAPVVTQVVVEVADNSFEVVEVGEQGPTSEDFVKYQEVSDVEVTGSGAGEITTIWKGEAAPGALHTQAVWRIRRVVMESGLDCDLDLTWAGGTASFTNVWEAVPADELYKTYDYDPNT